jgi:hypothetical protein
VSRRSSGRHVPGACLALALACASPPGAQQRLGADAMASVKRVAVEIPDAGSTQSPLPLENPDCRGPLEGALEQTLLASRRLQPRIAHEVYRDPDLVGFGALVRIEIEACGFRMVDQDRHIFSSFVDLTFRVKTSHTRSDGWKSRQSFAGNARASLLDLEANPELVRAEFRQVLRAAGRRLASELLYP